MSIEQGSFEKQKERVSTPAINIKLDTGGSFTFYDDPSELQDLLKKEHIIRKGPFSADVLLGPSSGVGEVDRVTQVRSYGQEARNVNTDNFDKVQSKRFEVDSEGKVTELPGRYEVISGGSHRVIEYRYKIDPQTGALLREPFIERYVSDKGVAKRVLVKK